MFIPMLFRKRSRSLGESTSKRDLVNDGKDIDTSKKLYTIYKRQT